MASLSRRLEPVILGACLAAAGCGTALTGGKKRSNDGDSISTSQYATKIDGAPATGQAVQDSEVQLHFSLDGMQLPTGITLKGYECRFGQETPFPCSGDPFVLSGLKDGEDYQLTVRAVLTDEKGQIFYGQDVSVGFTVKLEQEPLVGPGLSDHLQVGSSYQMKVPVGMHVTEFSTSKTTGVLSVFRVLPESDPYYLGNFTCDHDWDRIVASLSPAGEALSYCHSTPPRKIYDQDHEHRLANNHIEVATDTALVTSESHERLAISVFDRDWEFKASRSRFQRICLNSEKHHKRVPMLNDFFLGHNPEEVDFWYCDAFVAGMDGSPELWRVGAFYEADEIDWGCADCAYPRAVEAVYMVRANASVFTPAAFASVTQRRILDLLTKITP